jgi:hypothetical protein
MKGRCADSRDKVKHEAKTDKIAWLSPTESKHTYHESVERGYWNEELREEV